MRVYRARKAAKEEAAWATKIALGRAKPQFAGRIAVNVTAYPPKAWRTGDKDNFAARLKSHLDAIAKVIGVNDRQFESPIVEWGDRTESGKVVIELFAGEAA